MIRAAIALESVGIVAVTALPLDPWIQLGGIGVLGFLLYHHIKVMGSAVKTQAAERTKAVEHLADKHGECAERLEKKMDEVRQAIVVGNERSIAVLEKAVGLRNGGRPT